MHACTVGSDVIGLNQKSILRKVFIFHFLLKIGTYHFLNIFLLQYHFLYVFLLKCHFLLTRAKLLLSYENYKIRFYHYLRNYNTQC